MFMKHIVSRLQGKIQLNLCASRGDPGRVVQEGNPQVPLRPQEKETQQIDTASLWHMKLQLHSGGDHAAFFAGGAQGDRGAGLRLNGPD